MSRVSTLEKTSRTKARRARKRAAKTLSPAAVEAREATLRAADWAAPKVETAVDWAAPKVESAREWAAPRVGVAREWAEPKVEPVVDKVRKDVVPAVTGAVVTALAATEPQRSEIASRGAAALAALRGEVEKPKPKKHRLRRLVLLTTVVGAAYAAWKAYTARNQNPVDAWTSPPPATTATPSTEVGSVPAVGAEPSHVTDDAAGASPDEALADAADEAKPEPPAATTEPVSPAQAKKVAGAAAKGAGKGTSPGSAGT